MGLFDRLFHRTPSAPAAPQASRPPPRAEPEPEPGPTPGEALVTALTADHRECDTDWVAVEQAGSDAERAAAFTVFKAHLERHLDFEEKVLFPALEAAGLPPMGPIAVMVSDHRDMRGLLDAMSAAAEGGELERLLDQGDTLLMMTQQHNEKEEGVLYPMAADLVGARWEELARLR